jgi:branched-chain amino acid transport system ATP-binding protein
MASIEQRAASIPQRAGQVLASSMLPQQALASNEALVLSGVTRAFGALKAIDDVSFSVAAGERRAVLGSNGAGKTTLFNCITGDFPVTAGSIRFFGEDITLLSPFERIRRGLRRTYQISLLFKELTVRDNLFLAVRGVNSGRFSFKRPPPNHTSEVSATDLLSHCYPTANNGSWKLAWH